MKISNPVYQQKISDIYAEYKKTVSPLVAFLEANDAEYPVEILNEIRAILDCYKYNCVSLYDFYNQFRKEYKFADLSCIDNGDFLTHITQNFAEARNRLLNAKISERKNKDKEDLYAEYESAFDLFLKNFNLINSKIGIIHRVSKKARWSRFWGTFGFWISLALAVLGILLSVR